MAFNQQPFIQSHRYLWSFEHSTIHLYALMNGFSL
jgi:hypothetical protein